MHRWYDTKHGMFDVLDEADMRRLYAPKKWESDVLSPADAALLPEYVGVEFPGIDLRSAADMLAAGLDVRFDAGGGAPGDGSGVDVVAEEDFGTWLTLRDLDLASQLSSFWRNMDIRPDGEVVQSMKESDAESDVGFFRKLKDDLLRRDWLEDGEVTVAALARWCREVVGERFADTDDFPSLEHLADYMRLEFRIVQEQAARVRSSCAMEGLSLIHI